MGRTSWFSQDLTPFFSGPSLPGRLLCVVQRAYGRGACSEPQKLQLAFFQYPTYSCDVPLDTLKALPGGSFEVSLEAPVELHAISLQTTFQTKPDRGNLSLFANQIRDRFSTAYGKR